MLAETKEEKRVYWVILNRADKANAMNVKMWKDLSTKLDEGAESESTSMIAIKGNGKYFCAGADMADVYAAATQSAASELFVWTIRPAYDRILRSPKPVVAALNGPAIGGGVELVFACDMAVARPDAFFALSQRKYGIGPALGLTFGIPLIGRKRLAGMAMTGRKISAAKAEQWGLVNSVAKGKLETEVERLAQQVSETTPHPHSCDEGGPAQADEHGWLRERFQLRSHVFAVPRGQGWRREVSFQRLARKGPRQSLHFIIS